MQSCASGAANTRHDAGGLCSKLIFINLIHLLYLWPHMTLRGIEPLDDDQWKALIDALNKEPTPEQRQFLQKAIENGKKIKVILPPHSI